MHHPSSKSILDLFCRSAPLAVLLLGTLPLAVYSEPKTWIDRKQADFGAVPRGETVSEVFRLKNMGDEPLVIGRAEVSMPGMRINTRQAIGPGDVADLTVEWDTANHARAVEGQVVLHLNDPKIPRLTIALTGNVVSPIDILPYPAAYLSAYVGEAATRTLQIVNNEERPLKISRIEEQGDAFTAKLATDEPGRRYRLVIATDPSAAVGRHRQALVLHTDHPERPRLGVQVNVLVKPEVFVTPDAVDFGEVRRRDILNPQTRSFLTQTLTLRRKAGAMRIQRVTTDVKALQITREPEGAAQAFAITVALHPYRSLSGPLAGEIVIHTSDHDYRRIKLPVSGRILEQEFVEK